MIFKNQKQIPTTTSAETLSVEEQIKAAIKTNYGEITVTKNLYHGKEFFSVTGQTTEGTAVKAVLFIKYYKKAEPVPTCTEVEQKMLKTYAKFKGKNEAYFATFMLSKDGRLKPLQKVQWQNVFTKDSAALN